jgi:hypothetical protein
VRERKHSVQRPCGERCFSPRPARRRAQQLAVSLGHRHRRPLGPLPLAGPASKNSCLSLQVWRRAVTAFCGGALPASSRSQPTTLTTTRSSMTSGTKCTLAPATTPADRVQQRASCRRPPPRVRSTRKSPSRVTTPCSS